MRIIALAALLAACVFPLEAAAHIAGHRKESFEHRLKVRIAHDRGVIRSVDRQARHAGSALFLRASVWRTRTWHVRDFRMAVSALERVHAARVQRRQGFPSWWLAGAMCVHRGEGAWTSFTGNGFEGGMQFLNSTWLSSGGGRFAAHAHQASPREQLLVSYWLWRRAGWSPWPTTARMCGLL